MPSRRPPKFKNLSDEADFWDTHSPLDYASEFQEVEDVQFVRPPKEVMAIRMDRSTVKLIKEAARRLGVQHTTLARRWLVERVTEESKAPSSKPPSKRRSRVSRKAA